MKTIFTVVILLSILGCATPRHDIEVSRVTRRIDDIARCSTDAEQAAAIQAFYEDTVVLIRQRGGQSYSIWLFDAEGRFMVPSDNRTSFTYVLFIDDPKGDAMFLPFLVKPKGPLSKSAILANRI